MPKNVSIALAPHHDGSILYISNQRPALEDKIKIQVRIHPSLGRIRQVLIRQSDSGEGFLTPPMKMVDNRNGWDWYEGAITMFNPEIHYRFFLELDNKESFWLNPLGLFELDQPDRDDFKINIYNNVPNWATGSVMYQIFPDRFARSKEAGNRELPDWAIYKSWEEDVIGQGPGTAQQIFGGDLRGIEEHLDHLKKIGVTIIYLTPFFPSGSNHRYDASSFDVVDPLLGGNEALISMVKKAHEMGFKIIGDLTANHSGDKHEWFTTARRDPSAQESKFYYFSSDNSKYDSWLGVASLPKFNWKSRELRRRFIDGKSSVVAKWLKAPYQLDGWRIDVANMTGWIRDDDFNREVAQIIRKTMDQVSTDSFLVGEFTSDAAQQVDGDTYQSTMTYSNFTRPTWRWLWNLKDDRHEGMLGVGRKGIAAKGLMELHNSFAGTFPWHLRLHNLNALDTHDTGRFRSFAIPHSQKVAAGLQFTFPGIPMIFAGDEFGLEGWNGENSRTPIPWSGERETDWTMLETYVALSAIRKRYSALIEGSMRFLYASTEALVFVREIKSESVLVIASRGRDFNIEFERDALSGVENALNLFGDGALSLLETSVRYEAVELDFQIWLLPGAHRERSI